MEGKNLKGSEVLMHFGQKIAGDTFRFSYQDPDNPRREQLYRQLYYYFAKSPESGLDLRKGLLLQGDLGVGKTIMLRTFNVMFKAAKYAHAKRHIERDFKEYGEHEALKSYGYALSRPLTIDDVGVEEEETLSYRNRIFPVATVLLERYDLWQDSGIVTHIATNLNSTEINARYGERIFDRLKDAYNIIAWKGASLRKVS